MGAESRSRALRVSGAGARGSLRASWRMLRRQETRPACTESPENMSVQLAIAEEPALKTCQFSLRDCSALQALQCANTPKSVKIRGPYARRKNGSRREKIPESWKIFFLLFQLPYYSEKIVRHSESPCVTHQSPSKNFRTKNNTSDCSRSARRVTSRAPAATPEHDNLVQVGQPLVQLGQVLRKILQSNQRIANHSHFVLE